MEKSILLGIEEPIPEELQLSKEEIIKNRCDLLTSQFKILTETINKLTEENEKMKTLIINIYEKIGYSNSEDESDDEEVEEVPNVELEKKQD